MAPRTLVPPKNVLQRWQAEGLTSYEMADRTLAEFGNKVTRSAIAQALSRYGLTKERRRYVETVPWEVNPLHVAAAPLRNLRLLGKRIQGIELTEAERSRLEWFLANLADGDLIVAYDPSDDGPGFVYVSSRHRDHDDPGIPIRRKPVRLGATRRRRTRS